MKKTMKLAVPMAALAALLSLSAFAETRHRDETRQPASDSWRDGQSDDRRDNRANDRRDSRYDDRGDFVSGVVERINYRKELVVLREAASGRRVTVDMDRTDRVRRNRIELADLRRGDFVTLNGDWRRGGVFSALRITEVRKGRR